MSRLNIRSRLGLTGIAALSALLLISFSGCKNNNGPDKASIIVMNGCGAAIDFYLDEAFKVTVDVDASSTIEDVDQGSRTLKAIKTGAGILVAQETYEIYDGYDFNWTVDGPSTILVTNQFGETLLVYAGTKFLGELLDRQSQNVTEVPFGLLTLNAVRRGEATIVATTTLDITEAKEYEWTIAP